jgi:hypothetical protein
MKVVLMATHQADCDIDRMAVLPLPVGLAYLLFGRCRAELVPCTPTHCRGYLAALAFDVILFSLSSWERAMGLRFPADHVEAHNIQSFKLAC